MTTYNVDVTSVDNEMYIKVSPSPRPTDKGNLEQVTESIQEVILEYGYTSNTRRNRKKMKKALTDKLEEFQLKGWITPQEGSTE